MYDNDVVDTSSRDIEYIEYSNEQLNLNAYSDSVFSSLSPLFKKDKDKIVATVLVCNMMYSSQWGVGVAYPRDTSTKKWPKQYNKYDISFHSVRKVVGLLDTMGWVINKVSPAKQLKNGVWSSIRPTELCSMMFSKQEDWNDIQHKTKVVVELKDVDTKELVSYDGDSRGDEIACDVLDINMFFSSFSYTFKSSTMVNHYKRVFNGHWGSGGRWYSTGKGVQSIMNNGITDVQDGRLGIQIDGKHVCEVDFVSMHPALLLGLAGKKCDHYGIDVYAHILNHAGADHTDENRLLIKQSFMRVLNETYAGQAIMAIRGLINGEMSKANIYTRKAKQVFDDIINALPELGGLLVEDAEELDYKCAALKLQALDSDIVLKTCVKMKDIGVPVLILHDSLICWSDYEPHLARAMAESFSEVVKCDGKAYSGNVNLKVTRHDGSSEMFQVHI